MLVKPQIRWEGMRRLSALFLLLLCVMPCLVAFAASSAAEASLPACCRSQGRHRCSLRMRMEPGAQELGRVASHITEGCPNTPNIPSSSCTRSFGSAKSFSAVRFFVMAAPETKPAEGDAVFVSRANCKRGPPSPVLSPGVTD